MPDRTVEMALLKAFEGALKEGLLLDEALGGILGAALHYFDAPVVALLPGPGVPPMTRSGRSAAAPAAESRLSAHLEEILAQGRAKKTLDGGITCVGAPVKLKEQTQAAFGVVLPSGAPPEDVEEAVRLFARTVGHVLERDRTLSTLMKRREEAVALFELASGAFLSLNPEEVIRLTVSSLSRELEFDRVQAFRFHAETREVEELQSQTTTSGARPIAVPGRRPLESEEILLRCLSAHGPVFEDDEAPAGRPTRRKQMALPLHAGDAVFGFLTMSRRGGFILTAQELRLAQELAKLAAGALEKARLLESQRNVHERSAFVSRVHGSLSGLNDVVSIVRRTVEDVGPHFDLDLCAIRILPSGDLPGAQATAVKGGGGDATIEIPDALLAHLASEGSRIFLPDVGADSVMAALLPRGPALSRLPSPLAFVAVPLAYRGMPVGVLCGLAAGRTRGIPASVLAAFDDLAVEVSLAVASTRLLQQERDSVRFLEKLREVGRSLSTTFDLARIKQTLCEQSVSLLAVDAAQFWDADPASKTLQIAARWGADVGDAAVRPVPAGQEAHPVVRALHDRSPRIAAGPEASAVFAGASRLAIIPLQYHDEPIGVLTVASRRGDDFSADFRGRLELLADAGTISLHNARLMRLIEQQAERDAQTGLCNRVSLVKRLESEIRRAERNGQSIAVAHIRLDGLADAVARLEPGTADALLPKVASRLVRSTRAVNVVARDQADRFWILIFEATKVQAHRAMRAIQKNFEAQIDARLEPAGIRFALTTGISVYPDDAFDTAALLGRAAEALEEAVRTGPGAVVLYSAPAGAGTAAD